MSSRRGRVRPNGRRLVEPRHRSETGFTLVELLIVVTILPLIVGALSVGLISVFSLQSGVANRLSDTADAQVVGSSFENDVQSAAQITTSPFNTNNQCGPGTQLLGLEWNLVSTIVNGQTVQYYKDVVSYVELTSGSTSTLVRQFCNEGYTTPTNPNPTSSTTISYDLSPGQISPQIFPSAEVALASAGWTTTQPVTKVEFPIVEPKSKYSYTLAAVPADSSAVNTLGVPLAPAATAGCNFASPGTGTYASTLCLVDFSSLTGNNLGAAEQGCLEMSVPLPGGYTMYFCIGITGTTIKPHPLPTWSNAFLGNSCGGSTSCVTGTPFYTGIIGDPALYQTGSGLTTITISGITVVNPLGVPATGWQAVSADAESTDAGESVSWTADQPLTIIPNGQSYDTSSDPVGNACSTGANDIYNYGAGLTTSNGGLTVTCAVPSTVSIGLKTGTTMVEATTPTILTTTLVGAGLQAMVFGMMLS